MCTDNPYKVQKAERDREDQLQGAQALSLSSKNASDNEDTSATSSTMQTVTEDNAGSTNSRNTARLHIIVVPEENRSPGTTRLPPWRDDSQIYASRFIIAGFWGAQVGILAVGTFIVFHRGLFLPLGISSISRAEKSLRTESWIWFIVGCSLAAFLGVAIVLLTGCAIFSSLFVIYDDGIIGGDAEP